MLGWPGIDGQWKMMSGDGREGLYSATDDNGNNDDDDDDDVCKWILSI